MKRTEKIINLSLAIFFFATVIYMLFKRIDFFQGLFLGEIGKPSDLWNVFGFFVGCLEAFLGSIFFIDFLNESCEEKGIHFDNFRNEFANKVALGMALPFLAIVIIFLGVMISSLLRGNGFFETIHINWVVTSSIILLFGGFVVSSILGVREGKKKITTSN